MPKKKSKKLHKQPTKEELEAKEQEAIEASEDLESPPDELTPSEPEPSEPPEEELEEIEEEEETEKEEEKLKKKLSASARENQKIYAKNRVITKALADAEDIPEPTEDELKVEFRDWDVMSETERTFAKETLVSRKWRETIAKAKEQATKIEKWNESVDEFVGNPKTFVSHPDLEGKADEFEEFAKKEDNNSVPFETLVGAFLYEKSKTKKVKKGSMFEKGKGGAKEKPRPKEGKLTLEESRKLRDTDYNKWKEYLKAGKIDIDI